MAYRRREAELAEAMEMKTLERTTKSEDHQEAAKEWWEVEEEEAGKSEHAEGSNAE